jgi:glycosyltransferase involved in cell wall biosynthesis
MLMLDRVRQRAHEFDVIHFHIDQFHFPLFRPLAARTVTTLHGRQDLADLWPLYLGFKEMPLVSISFAQRSPVPYANFVANIPHGIPPNLLSFTPRPKGGYVAFIGRIAPEKRTDRAIHIARSLGIPLKIAAKVDRVDEAYFESEIKPMLNEPGVEFIGEINDHQKNHFLGEALALLFPIDWPEPFGLAMIEAMACGTPVLAFRRGSVPEAVDDGITGAIVDTADEAVTVLPRVISLDRHKIRRQFERRFGVERMTRSYVTLYKALVAHAGEPTAEDTPLMPDNVPPNARGLIA